MEGWIRKRRKMYEARYIISKSDFYIFLHLIAIVQTTEQINAKYKGSPAMIKSFW